jgi:two-component system OmpR family response regulator
MRVLLIEDDDDLTATLDDYLSRQGFEVAAVNDANNGVAQAVSGSYEIVVLGAMLADLDGIELLERIRRESQVPVLMLSSKGANHDRIRGLELGADDCVPKPCPPRELAARIRAILRRTHAATEPPVVSGALAMWPQRRQAEWHGCPLELTITEFNLLEVLARHAGAPVGKNALSELALGRPVAPYDRNIDVHLSSVRRKLGVAADERSHIQTVRRLGYQFIEDP